MEKKHLPVYTVSVVLISVVLTFLIAGGLFGTSVGYAGERFSKLLAAARIIDQYSLYGVDEEQASDEALRSYVNTVGDPYTTYFSTEEYAAFNEQVKGKYAGVGLVVLTRADDNRVTVSRCLPESPAERAGILRGDKVLRVDGTEVSADQLDDAVARMKGEAGTEVMLEVLRAETGEVFSVELIREEITLRAVDSTMLDGEMGLIRISTFNESAEADFRAAVELLREQGAQGIVIDLRDNPGGIYQVCTAICDYLLPEGTIVYTQNKSGEKEVVSSGADEVDLRFAVLVNGASASASEIMAAALKDFKKAVIVGEQTFGKGVVQTTFDLDDQTALKVTVSEYFSPNGSKIQGIGVTPDVVVKLDQQFDTTAIEDIPHEQDNQLQKALEVLRGE